MVTLTLGNSESSLQGLSLSQLKEVRELLSYTLPVNYQAKGYYGRGGQKKHLMDKRGNYPSGLDSIVYGWLCQTQLTRLAAIKYSYTLPDRQEGLFKRKSPVTPYQDQTWAVEAAVEHSRGVITAPTGSGKSNIITMLIEAFQLPTLIVVPNLELKRQLSEILKKEFGSLKNISIENIDSTTLGKNNNFELLIIDEAHHAAANTYRKLNKTAWTNIHHRFCLTATPFRSRSEEQLLLQGVIGDIIYTLEHKAAVEAGYICPVEAYYVEILPVNVTNRTYNYASAYKELIVHNDFRNAIIHELLLTFHASNVSTLCLVKEVRHGEILSSDNAFPFVSGQNDERHLIAKFVDKSLITLIGTTGVMGEGVDTKPCEYVIIASPMKSRNLFMQCAGRAFRQYPGKESAKIILLKDASHKWFKDAFKEQCLILKQEYGIVPTKLFLDKE